MLLTVITSALLPPLIIVNNERMTMREEQKALFILEQKLSNWVYEDIPIISEETMINDTLYLLAVTQLADHHIRLCIHWNGANDRLYERCEEAKK